jgi:hypothetical protein
VIVAKPKRKSKTLWFNDISNGLNALALAILASSEEIRNAVPWWVYLLLMVASNTVNRFLRLKTTEPVK